MAKAKKLPSGRWRCQVYSHTEVIIGEDGKKKEIRKYKSFTDSDKKQAELKAIQFLATKNNYKPICSMTYGEALDKYIEERSSTLSPSTIREYKRSRRCDFQDLMDIKLQDITQDMVQRAVNAERRTHSPKSVRNMHGLFSAVIKAYRPEFKLNTALPQKVRPQLYIPTDEEVKKIIDYVQESDPDMEIPILLAAFGPMRRSEICALESSDISGNIVHITKAMVLNDDHEWIIKKPKSYAGDRFIDFPEFVITKIKNQKGRIVSLNPAMVSNRFSDDLKRAGVPHFRFHDLRHYCASIQHAIGIPDAYIMQRGGWGSDAVLKSVYRHALEEKEKEMSDKANKYFSELCNTKCNTN